MFQHDPVVNTVIQETVVPVVPVLPKKRGRKPKNSETQPSTSGINELNDAPTQSKKKVAIQKQPGTQNPSKKHKKN